MISRKIGHAFYIEADPTTRTYKITRPADTVEENNFDGCYLNTSTGKIQQYKMTQEGYQLVEHQARRTAGSASGQNLPPFPPPFPSSNPIQNPLQSPYDWRYEDPQQQGGYGSNFFGYGGYQ